MVGMFSNGLGVCVGDGTCRIGGNEEISGGAKHRNDNNWAK